MKYNTGALFSIMKICAITSHKKHHLHVYYKLNSSAQSKYSSAATAYSTTGIIRDMPEGWGLTIFRRSIH